MASHFDRSAGAIKSISGLMLLMLWCHGVSAADVPATQPAEPTLPKYAMRRLGDLRFADDGTRVAFISDDDRRLICCGNYLTVWDLATGWQLQSYRPEGRPCTAAGCFGAHQIAVVSNAGTTPGQIDVLDEQTLTVARQVPATWTGAINEFSAAPDGSRFAIVTDHMLLCDGKTGETIRDFGVKPRPGMGPGMAPGTGIFIVAARMGFSADSSTFFAVTGDGLARVIDPVTGKDKTDQAFAAAYGAAISGDGKLLACISDDHQVHLHDLTKGEELPVAAVESQPATGLLPHKLFVWRVSFANHGGMLACTYNAPGFSLLDTSVRPLAEPRHLTPDGIGIGGVLLTGDGSKVIASAFGRRCVLDSKTGQIISPAGVSMKEILSMTASPDGHELLVGNQEGEIFRWDLEQGKLLEKRDGPGIAHIQYQNRTSRLSFTDDGKSVMEIRGATAQLIDPKTLKTVRPLFSAPQDEPFQFNGQVFSSDGRWRAQTTAEDLMLVDGKTGTSTVLQHVEPVAMSSLMRPAVFSPDRSLLVCTTNGGPRVVETFTHQIGPVISISKWKSNGFTLMKFSPNSRLALTQMGKTYAMFESRRLLETPEGYDPRAQQPRQFGRANPPAPVSTVPPIWTSETGGLFNSEADFGSSGELFALLSPEETKPSMRMTVRESRTGRVVLDLPMPTQTAVKFISARPMVATADRAGTVVLWDLKSALLDGIKDQKDSTDDQLWDRLTDADPAVAYRAGFQLIDRHQLSARASALGPMPDAADNLVANRVELLIAGLSSPDKKDREKSHRTLEGLGAAAIGQIRAALEQHPQGDLKERLDDIAHVIGADDPAVPTLPPSAGSSLATDGATMRTARVLQLLEWSDEPDAAVQLKRLTTAMPASK